GGAAHSRWTHVAVTWDGSTTMLYMDGRPVSTGVPDSGGFGDIDPTFAIGCQISALWTGSDRIQNFTGGIGVALLYKRALAAAEIASYWAAADPCAHPVFADGTTCNDGNLCTQTDTCQSGTCIGTNPVVCAAQDQCHTVGTCATGTGVCSNPVKADGTTCDD